MMGAVTQMARRVLRGVVFDMDGTLNVPCIDYADMRRRVGIPTGDILHVIDGWSPERQEKAYKILAEIELGANENMKVMPVYRLKFILADANGAVLGRDLGDLPNAGLEKHQVAPFEPALSREFRPYKPDPGPLLHICGVWGIPPHEVMMIGDSAKDDIVCGNRAGTITCLLDDDGRYDLASMPTEQHPDFKVSSLVEVGAILEEHFDLRPIGH